MSVQLSENQGSVSSLIDPSNIGGIAESLTLERTQTNNVRDKVMQTLDAHLDRISSENSILQEQLNKINADMLRLQEEEKAREQKLLAEITAIEASIKDYQGAVTAFVNVNAGNKQTINVYTSMNANLTAQANKCCAESRFRIGQLSRGSCSHQPASISRNYSDDDGCSGNEYGCRND